MICSFFTDRDCCTLVRPCEEERDLQRLQSIPDSGLRPEFVNQKSTVKAKVFKKVKPKVLNQTVLTGQSLLSCAQAYLDAINSGGVPCIETAWTSICKTECLKLTEQCLQKYS